MPVYLIESVIAFLVLMVAIPSAVYGGMRLGGMRQAAKGISLLVAIFIFLFCMIFVVFAFPGMFTALFG